MVSVIITSRNEEAVIKRLTVSILNQSYKVLEIIFVDNNSTDRTKEIAGQFTKKVFNFGPERSAQRNFGARKAKGEYLLFLDADMKLSSKVVKECVLLTQKDRNIAGVFIPEVPVAGSFWERVKAFERSFYNLEGDGVTDAARFFSKKVFEEVGGYDELITGPEDWDLTERIRKRGYKVGRIKARIYHFERVPNLFTLAKKKYYYGLKAHRYLEKQRISPVSPKSIYFLRPVFYKNWRRLTQQPVFTLCMFFMFLVEMLAGGVGFLMGKFKNL